MKVLILITALSFITNLQAKTKDAYESWLNSVNEEKERREQYERQNKILTLKTKT